MKRFLLKGIRSRCTTRTKDKVEQIMTEETLGQICLR